MAYRAEKDKADRVATQLNGYKKIADLFRQGRHAEAETLLAALANEKHYYQKQFEMQAHRCEQLMKPPPPPSVPFEEDQKYTLAVYAAIQGDGCGGYLLDCNWRTKRTSVVITNHDYECYLEECLESWTRQTVEPDEIILVNDATHGDPAPILARFPQVKSFNVNFRNAQKARNFGYSKTTGEIGDFISFADADDKVDPKYIELGKEALRNKRFVLAAPRIQRFNKIEDKEPREWSGHEKDVWFTPGHIHTAAMMRRYAFEAVGGFRESVERYQDWDLQLALLGAGFMFTRSQGIYRYRVHGGTSQRGSDYNWQRQSRTDIIRNRQRIAVLTAFGGQRIDGNNENYVRLVRRYYDALLAQDYPRKMLELVWYDNSGDPKVSELIDTLAKTLPKEGFASICVIRDERQPLGDTGRYTSKERIWQLTQRVREIYTEMICKTRAPLILMWEDDIIPPANGIGRLVEALSDRDLYEWPNIAGVSGFYQSRALDGQPLAFRFKSYQPLVFGDPHRSRIYDEQATYYVAGVGQGFLLMRHPYSIGFSFRGEDCGTIHGVDLAMSRDVALLGLKWLLCTEVRCAHVTPEGKDIIPGKQPQPLADKGSPLGGEWSRKQFSGFFHRQRAAVTAK